MGLNDLGVGVSYSPQIESILRSNASIVNVLEIEPQTIWDCDKTNNLDTYSLDTHLFNRIKSYTYSFILHSVATPIGGTIQPEKQQLEIIKYMAENLQVSWISEHLSFNQFKKGNHNCKTAFFLPPRQTYAGVRLAVESIKEMQKEIGRPVAIENTVNYLKPRDDELSDGEFVSKVITYANCGLVLDLHNLWTNEINGRQSIMEFINQIPLDKVWEIHLAGGTEDSGYWLDSHSGKIPPQLLEITKMIISRLKNLHAIIYEIEPSYLSVVDDNLVKSQLKQLHKLWELKTCMVTESNSLNSFPNHKYIDQNYDTRESPTPNEWERVLGTLSIGYSSQSKLATELSSDPGMEIIKKRIEIVRSSLVIRSLKLTSTLLIIGLGLDKFKNLLREYWQQESPELFASSEGKGFAKFLANKNLNVQYLDKVLELELAMLNSSLKKEIKEIQFNYDPRPLLNSILNRSIPETIPEGDFIVRVTKNHINIIGND
jgi:uncharacterized protein (UPF0276 family)